MAALVPPVLYVPPPLPICVAEELMLPLASLTV
jgi:hypothetical protein